MEPPPLTDHWMAPPFDDFAENWKVCPAAIAAYCGVMVTVPSPPAVGGGPEGGPGGCVEPPGR
jgi:hypothetical protein